MVAETNSCSSGGDRNRRGTVKFTRMRPGKPHLVTENVNPSPHVVLNFPLNASKRTKIDRARRWDSNRSSCSWLLWMYNAAASYLYERNLQLSRRFVWWIKKLVCVARWKYFWCKIQQFIFFYFSVTAFVHEKASTNLRQHREAPWYGFAEKSPSKIFRNYAKFS